MKNKPTKFYLPSDGSALVLTIIILVNALLIVTTITAISIIEQKASGKVRNSTPAFQAADSAMEWALKKVQDPAVIHLSDLCTGGFDAVSGKCDPNIAGLTTEIYFIGTDGKVITDSNAETDTVESIRTVGRVGDGEDRVSRALEVHLGHSGPIAWWPFLAGESGGNSIEDVTENMNDATLNDGTWEDAGATTDCFDVSDTCMEFDPGVNLGLEYPDPPNANDDFAEAPDLAPIYQIDNGTIAFWFKANDTSGLIANAQILWSKEADEEWSNHLSICILNNNSFLSMYPETLPSNDTYIAIRFQENIGIPNPEDGNSYWSFGDAPVNEDQWYFMVFTFGSSGMNLYVAEDGDIATALQIAGINPYTGGMSNNLEPIQFGVSSITRDLGSAGPLWRPFDGYMDDIRIYDYQLNQVQIDALYNDGPY